MKNTKLFALGLFLLALVAMASRFWSSMMIVVVAAILGYLLTPLVNWLCNHLHMKRGLAATLVILALLSIFVGVLSSALPTIVRQISALISELGKFTSNLDSTLAGLVEWLQDKNVPDSVINTLMTWISQSDQYLTSFLSGMLTTLIGFSTRLFDAMVIIILMVYFLMDWDKLADKLITAFPDHLQTHLNRMRGEAHTMVWNYVGSRCLISVGMAVVTYIGLMIIGVPYALLFAIMSFVLDFVPYFGSILAGIVEGVVALMTGGLSMAITTIIFVLVVQQIEGNIVAPKVQSGAVGLHPITVMFALLACQQLWGPVGMLISTPVAALVKMVLKEIFSFAFSPDTPEPPAPAAAPAEVPQAASVPVTHA